MIHNLFKGFFLHFSYKCGEQFFSTLCLALMLHMRAYSSLDSHKLPHFNDSFIKGAMLIWTHLAGHIHHTYKMMHGKETHRLPWGLNYHGIPVICKRLRRHKLELIWSNELVCAVWPFATVRTEVQTPLGG